MSSSPPHIIPYQGSKRRLAPRILERVAGAQFKTLYEPFAGSAALTIAAARMNLAERYVIGDTLPPLVEIWEAALNDPAGLADEYERIWKGQLSDPNHYNDVRAEFNEHGGAARLLYLLARCVKNAPRFNSAGEFNQSPDKRRQGMHPDKMRRQVHEVSALLAGKTEVRCADAAETLSEATAEDLVYMDPPWHGTTVGDDKRYHSGYDRDELIALLSDLNQRSVPFLLSYDGRLGERTYTEPLPQELNMELIELHAGRSSQATLAGRAETTIESLYVSENVPDDVEATLFALSGA